MLCLGFRTMAVARRVALTNRELKEVFHNKVDFEEECYALTPRQSEEMKQVRLQHIKKIEDVDIHKSTSDAGFDTIVRDLQRQYKFDDTVAQTLRNTKGSGARCKVCRMYSFDHGKVDIVYGVFAAARVAYNEYDLIVAYYHNSFDAYRVDGKPITEGVLENQQRLQALKYFRSEAKGLLRQ